MSVASGTATTAELNTLYDAAFNLVIMLRAVKQGDGYGGATPATGRFTPAQIDTQITAVSAAITAVNA